MKEQTYFHIPAPCHENWDNMTPEGKGRFCASCSKQVVDFSLMSDQQVLNYFKNTTGKVCGRFADDQLQRPMIAAAEQKKKIWWVAAMMPVLLFAKKDDKGNAIRSGNLTIVDTIAPPEILMGKVAPVIEEQTIDTVITADTGIILGTVGMVIPEIMEEPNEEILPNTSHESSELIDDAEVKSDSIRTIGDTIIITSKFEKERDILLKGKVIDDENNEPISYATVSVKGTNKFTTTDSAGNFSLRITDTDKHGKLVISSVGYSVEEVSIDDSNWNNIELYRQNNVLPDVVVSAGKLITCSRVTSGMVMVMGKTVRKTNRTDTLKSAIKNILNIRDFKSYPNPVVRGSIIKIEIAKPGEYSLQVIDNSAKLILVKDITTVNEKSVTEITIPSSVASGIYYIRMIDGKKKKQYTDKLIVQ